MKTGLVVGAVVAAHVVVVGSLLMMQGCGTMKAPVTQAPEPVMPPAEVTELKTLPPVTVPAAKSWPADTTTYVVEKGDSLSVIAKRFDLTAAEIAALNGISKPNMIRVGQKLMLPGKVDLGKPRPVTVKKVKPHAVTKSASTGAAAVVGEGGYVVQPGDSLSVIAKKHGTTTAALKKANSLTGDQIRAGQKLAIPADAKSAPVIAPVEMAPVVLPEATIPAPVADTAVGAPQVPAVPAAGAVVDPTATPVVTPVVAPAETASPVEAGKPTATRIHVVEPDEDLYSVAMMWGTSVDKLKELNGLSDTKVKPGDRLKVPVEQP